ncbi:MAG: citrate synthase, partial [Lachnospiraceae bacterium]|nr:citrate synthase [Lachnospiraceae bacterium]
MAEKELKLYDSFLKNNQIDNKYYEKYQVKRGLRNQDGTGVMAGVTNICNVHGYIVNEGEKEPDEGELTFRGYSIKELINNVEKEKRFGYEEIVYLLLSGELPSKEQLKQFNSLIDENRQLPNDFFGDMILKAPSLNIMNKLSRSVLSLYSYDDCPDMITPKHEIDTAISVISKLPVIMVLAYYVKQSAYCGESMIMHPIIPGQSTAETILSTLRKDRQFTDEEAKILDVVLMLHAEHGGGNNSTFSCRVLSSSGTDPYS